MRGTNSISVSPRVSDKGVWIGLPAKPPLMNLKPLIPAFFFLTLPVFILSASYSTCRAAETPAAVLLSVQDFEALGVDNSLARTVSDLLRTELARSDRLRLLEETGRLYRMQRESARFRDLFNEGTLRSLGELLESRFVLTGAVSRLDSVIVISSRVGQESTVEQKVDPQGQVRIPNVGLMTARRLTLPAFESRVNRLLGQKYPGQLPQGQSSGRAARPARTGLRCT